MSKKWSAPDKTAIVMEHLTTGIGTAELCRRHNLAPRTCLSGSGYRTCSRHMPQPMWPYSP